MESENTNMAGGIGTGAVRTEPNASNAPKAPSVSGSFGSVPQADKLNELFGNTSFASATTPFNEQRNDFDTNGQNAVNMLSQQYRSLLGTVAASARQRMRSISQPPDANATNANGDLFSGAFRNDAHTNVPQTQEIPQPPSQTVAQMNGVTTETVGGKPSSSYMYGNTRIAIPDGIDINDDKAMGGFIAENNAIIDFMDRSNDNEEEV